jgi:predicted dehydrogenase
MCGDGRLRSPGLLRGYMRDRACAPWPPACEGNIGVEPLKLGMIGVGQMGSAHTRAMAPLEEVRVVAVADVDAARARAVGEAVGARAFTDAHALIRRGGVEAVLIATPHTVHAPLALYAAQRGVHVLSEKPLAISAAAADRVIATCQDHGVLLGVMFQQRTDPSWRTIKRLVEGGLLGAVYRLSLVTTAYRPQAYYASAAWRGTWAGEGGGVLMNQAPHALDLFLWIGGMPQAVQGLAATRLHRIAVEDVALALCTYGQGKVGWLYATTAEVAGSDRLEVVGERGALVWEEGRVRHLTLDPPLSTHLCSSAELLGQPRAVWREVAVTPASHGYLEVIKAFARAVRAHDESLLVATGEDGRRAVELANAILLASCTRREVSLPLNRRRYARLLRQLQRGTVTLDGSGGQPS